MLASSFLNPSPCSSGQGGVEEGHAWASVAEGWGLDMLCHSSSVTLDKLLDFSGTPSPLREMMYFSFIHSFMCLAHMHSMVMEIKV